MVPVKKDERILYIQSAFGLIPLIMSLAFVKYKSFILLIAIVIAMFLIIGLVPVCRHRENLWMFLLTAVTGIPINIFFVYYMILEEWIDPYLFIGKFLWGGLLYCILFSVEETVFGVITRFIWKRQYKIGV